MRARTGIKLEHEQIYRGNLILVNASFPLKEGAAKDLVPVDPSIPDVRMKHDAADVLQLVLEKISADGDIVPVSGYRSSEEQTELYRESLRLNGKEFTEKYVALPDHSEHQTGLAIDLGLNCGEIDFIRPNFPYEGICEKFRREAPNYGFIERYKKGKEKITGIAHEPWHFRYVGYPHSNIMEDVDLSLEEYIDFLKNYRDDRHLIYDGADGVYMEIFYVPAAEDETPISLQQAGVYRISGNNMDGFIVTVWRREND